MSSAIEFTTQTYVVRKGLAKEGSLVPAVLIARTEQVYSTKGLDKLPNKAEVVSPSTVTLNESNSDTHSIK